MPYILELGKDHPVSAADAREVLDLIPPSYSSVNAAVTVAQVITLGGLGLAGVLARKGAPELAKIALEVALWGTLTAGVFGAASEALAPAHLQSSANQVEDILTEH